MYVLEVGQVCEKTDDQQQQCGGWASGGMHAHYIMKRDS